MGSSCFWIINIPNIYYENLDHRYVSHPLQITIYPQGIGVFDLRAEWWASVTRRRGTAVWQLNWMVRRKGREEQRHRLYQCAESTTSDFLAATLDFLSVRKTSHLVKKRKKMNINEPNLKKKSRKSHLWNTIPRVKVVSLCLIHSIRAYVLLSFYLKYVRII